MDDKDRLILKELCFLLGVSLRGLHMMNTQAVNRVNALKTVLVRRGLMTDAEWPNLLKEVQAAVAVQLALGFSEEEQRQVDSALGTIDSLLADKDGAVLKPVVDSLKQMLKRLA